MKKTKIVKEILVKRLEPYGFEYNTYVHGRWELERTLENGVKQYIAVCKSPHISNEVRLEMNTSVEFRCIYMDRITNDPKYSQQYISYSSDEDFIRILELFVDFIFEHGLRELEKTSTPSSLILPDEQMYLNIFNNNAELAENFIINRKLAERYSLEDAYELVKQIVVEKDEREYDQEAKQLLVECTAFFCNKIISTYGGN